eukprot:2643003-Prymnesium_polylepis.1
MDKSCQVQLYDCRERRFTLGCACFTFGGYGETTSFNECAPNGLGRCVIYLGSAHATQSSGYSECTVYGVRSGVAPAPPAPVPSAPPGICENTCLYPEDGT